jgi:FAD/FMN-containing dehydrogenase
MVVDNIVGATVVLADGSIVHCSADENEDVSQPLRRLVHMTETFS